MEDKKLAVLLPGSQDRTDDYLMRTRRLLERAIRQRWADGLLSRDPETASFSQALGPAEIERLMRPPAPVGSVGTVEDYAYERGSPLAELQTSLHLQPTEADTFAVLLAVETDPACARLVSYLSGNPSSPAVTVDTLFEVVYRPRSPAHGEAAMLLHADLAVDGPARRLQFILVEGSDSRSFLSQGIRLAPRLVSWLLGRRSLDAELSAHAKLIAPEPVRGEVDAAAVLQIRRAIEARGRLLSIRGVPGAGRELLLRTVAHQLGRSLLLVSGRGLAPDKITAAFREAALHRALLAFRDAEEAFSTEDARHRLRDCLAIYPETISMIGLGASDSAVSAIRTTIDIAVPVPEHAARMQLWRSHLPPDSALTEHQRREIAGLYNLGVGGIVAACDVARELAASESTQVTRAHVARAVRQLFESDLTAVAKHVVVTQTWDDVVLPEEVVDSIIGLVDRIAFRNEVFGDWGFGRKVGKGLGLTALFSGQPGTGKSMVAGLIARELGLDLYVIDLSRIMSKWLGETEKNLARAFDAAEAGHVLLLFDEADSILGKRTTEMRSSNDRHANLETNFILARLEQFQGIAIFTTNIASAVDPAILRRMSANIVFPFPDVEARADLWRRMIPAEAPVAARIDFMDLAKRFQLSGGFIRNVVLRAAFLAAREGLPISASHLERAAKSEYGDRGALTSGGRLS